MGANCFNALLQMRLADRLNNLMKRYIWGLCSTQTTTGSVFEVFSLHQKSKKVSTLLGTFHLFFRLFYLIALDPDDPMRAGLVTTQSPRPDLPFDPVQCAHAPLHGRLDALAAVQHTS